MPLAIGAAGAGRAVGAVLFLGGVEAAYNIISASLSSPQSIEISATDRAKSMRRWVYIGEIQLVVATGAAMYIAGPGFWQYPFIGAAPVALLMWCLYGHALKAGGAAPEDQLTPRAGSRGLPW